MCSPSFFFRRGLWLSVIISNTQACPYDFVGGQTHRSAYTVSWEGRHIGLPLRVRGLSNTQACPYDFVGGQTHRSAYTVSWEGRHIGLPLQLHGVFLFALLWLIKDVQSDCKTLDKHKIHLITSRRIKREKFKWYGSKRPSQPI